MSSKIEVSREFDLLKEASEWIKTNSFGGTDAVDLWERIDARIAAPVVERQPVAWMFKNDNNRIERIIWWEPQPDEAPSFWPAPIALYEAPPELAELQATIARRTADLASANADKEAYAQNAIDLRLRVNKLTAENERLKGGQGESVAQMFSGSEGNCCIWFSRPADGTNLYVSKLAPVPAADPCEWSDGQILDFLGVALRNVDLSGGVKLSEIRQGFEYVRDNACLDKVKELNQ